MPDYTYQSPVLYLNSFGIDHVMYHWTPGTWSMEGDDFSVRSESIPTLDLNRKIITQGVRSPVKWVQEGDTDVYLNARKSTRQKWVGQWGEDSFMTKCMRNHLDTLYTTQQGFWITFDDEMSYEEVTLEAVDNTYKYYLLPTYPIAYYRQADITGQNMEQTMFFKLYKNGVALENVDSPWIIDPDTGIVYFSTAMLSTDVITMDYQWRLYCRISNINLYPLDQAQNQYVGAVEFEQLKAPNEVPRFDHIIFEGDPCVGCQGPRIVDQDGDDYEDPPPDQDECAGWEITTLTLDDLDVITTAGSWVREDGKLVKKTGNSPSVIIISKDTLDIPENHAIVGIVGRKYVTELNRPNQLEANTYLGVAPQGSLTTTVTDPDWLYKADESADMVDSGASLVDINGSPGDTTYGDTDLQYARTFETYTTSQYNSGISAGMQLVGAGGGDKFTFGILLDSDNTGKFTRYNGGAPFDVSIAGNVTDNYTTHSFTSDVFRVTRAFSIASANDVNNDAIYSKAHSDGTITFRITHNGTGTPPELASVRVYGWISAKITARIPPNSSTNLIAVRNGEVGGIISTITIDSTTSYNEMRFDFDQTFQIAFDQTTGIAETEITFSLQSESDGNFYTPDYSWLASNQYNITADFNIYDYIHELELDIYHREVCDSGDQYTTTQLTQAGSLTPTGTGANGAEITWTYVGGGTTNISTQLMGIDYSRVAPSDAHLVGAYLTFDAMVTSGTLSLNTFLATQSTFPHSGGDSEFNDYVASVNTSWQTFSYGGTFVLDSISQTLRWSDIDGVFPYFQVPIFGPGRTLKIRNVQVVVYFAQVVTGA